MCFSITFCALAHNQLVLDVHEDTKDTSNYHSLVTLQMDNGCVHCEIYIFIKIIMVSLIIYKQEKDLH